jgi:hypothetical protein
MQKHAEQGHPFQWFVELFGNGGGWHRAELEQGKPIVGGE